MIAAVQINARLSRMRQITQALVILAVILPALFGRVAIVGPKDGGPVEFDNATLVPKFGHPPLHFARSCSGTKAIGLLWNS